jgi:acyl-CoA reductase-like NAD-dependent aldehyde dehydrogenase
VAKEETFAPSAPLIALRTDSDVIAMATIRNTQLTGQLGQLSPQLIRS